ncbi:uncharacterized protein BO95DRAFT_429695 [Aspergillus brunneoviolaceus CBS 621.78]|uniref:Uncharacterized protein n=1 Tax=Aspergillus brunneoviolaceus CBS 621.78 TaxID=1450534 RepID=A0ACD1GGV2_9EURO|nr:hypothetical protein BO95DRAFT_429695 [Aspergillus brunneoviolaceus CBS 621.78]RAH48316.1 hypothetical protein BO95DRAFT_429695 [Aspergillus brunneoviolaceus CBS 621.78]
MGLLPMKSFFQWFGFSKTRKSKEDHSCRLLDDTLIHSNTSYWSLSELPFTHSKWDLHYISIEHALRSAEHIEDLPEGKVCYNKKGLPYQEHPKEYENREKIFPPGKTHREGPLRPEDRMWKTGTEPGPARIIGPQKEHEPRCRKRPHWKLPTYWKPCYHDKQRGYDDKNMVSATYHSVHLRRPFIVLFGVFLPPSTASDCRNLSFVA